MSAPPIYCIDTSSILEARTRTYPPAAFPTLWDRVEALIDAGRLLSPIEMLKELERKDDETRKWARAKSGLFVPYSPQQIATVTQILTTHPLLVDSSKGRSGGDPFLIALALIEGYTLVTEEVATNSPKKPRIPDVCIVYKVPYITFLDLVIAEGWTF